MSYNNVYDDFKGRKYFGKLFNRNYSTIELAHFLINTFLAFPFLGNKSLFHYIFIILIVLLIPPWGISLKTIAYLFFTIFILSFSLYHSSVFADTLITADDPRINFYGRFDHSKADSPKYTWSGSAIEAAFFGPKIGFRIVDGSADYDVEIDSIRTSGNDHFFCECTGTGF